MHAFYDRMTDRTRRSLEAANKLAFDRKHPLVTNLHVLWGMIEEGRNIAFKVLSDMKVDLKVLKAEIEEFLGKGTYSSHDKAVCYDEDVRQVICDAISLSIKDKTDIGSHHLLLAILASDTPAVRILDRFNVTQELVDAYVGAVVKPVS
jgi:ATP-dependent Clp protease ATP-binding subunit ClpA